MSNFQHDYLKLHESLARTNSPQDQPPFDDMNAVLEIFQEMLSVDGKLNTISQDQYEKLLKLVQKEIDSQ